MRHVVFGAGLIGGYLAGTMISKGLNVALVARPSVQQKLKAGLRLTDYEGHEASIENVSFVHAEQSSGLPAAQACEYLWLTVKCTAIESALPELHSFVGPDTVIFCVQNGLGSEQSIKNEFPNNKIMRVMVVFNVAEPSEGHLHRGSQGSVSIEGLDAHPEISREMVAQINCPLLPAESCQQMSALLWAKLQFNLANAVNALADVPIKKMIENRSYRLVVALLMKELVAVADAKKIRLPKLTALPPHWIPGMLTLPNFVFNIVGQRTLAIDPTVRTSMWWDLSAGKLTEVEYLNGAVVREGKELGLDCPANKKLVAMVHQAEAKELKQGIDAKTFLTLLQP